jgi:hypothetical protein
MTTARARTDGAAHKGNSAPPVATSGVIVPLGRFGFNGSRKCNAAAEVPTLDSNFQIYPATRNKGTK